MLCLHLLKHIYLLEHPSVLYYETILNIFQHIIVFRICVSNTLFLFSYMNFIYSMENFTDWSNLRKKLCNNLKLCEVKQSLVRVIRLLACLQLPVLKELNANV